MPDHFRRRRAVVGGEAARHAQGVRADEFNFILHPHAFLLGARDEEELFRCFPLSVSGGL